MHTLPQLDYAYDALEPHFDARTMEIHHSKHHNAYVSKLNDAISGSPAENLDLDALMKAIDGKNAAVRNNGGGHYNHSFFWKTLQGNAPQAPQGALATAIDTHFGSFDGFKKAFATAAATRFGSGWAWLVKQGDKLVVGSTPNQDNPLMKIAEVQGAPLLGLDVWEHAYYLNYQNRRPDYIEAFWSIVDWEKVGKLYSA